MNIVFLDRDGTLIAEPPDEQVDSLEKLEILPGVIHGLARLRSRGYLLVMVSNQDHLGSDRYPRSVFDLVQGKLFQILAGEGIEFTAVFICPHGPTDGCACRKPKTGLVEEFLRAQAIDPRRSWMVGDRPSDAAFGRKIGCRTIGLSTASMEGVERFVPTFAEAVEHILRQDRIADVHRSTAETDIRVGVCLDGTGTSEIRTSVGFLDHMLAQLAKHSGIDLSVTVAGDLHVDEHHTVEDTGLAIGDAIRQALGDRKGIGRYGYAVPMDESRAEAVLDLSGRPHCRLEASFHRERVGDLPTELIEDFFRALADGLRANLHLRVKGRNDHHQIEALFKATARALRQATSLDARTVGLPTTKGML